ncbi:ATP-binding protein [Cytophagales bacterium LB-30]|uniref:histidine kinase n=1 Tax=Shiella aurantiaca TaxID=3058365 RepID=A0ABT8F8Y3_9BACT|nr:ATP-binding protein [Shiella aurantiaca]MDN4166661.1 ATP-binding protein [Shiella aurantiaca]
MPEDFSQISFIIIASACLVFAMTSFIAFMVVYHRGKQLKNKQHVQQLTLEFQKALADSEREIQEQTFTHVGQELHDNVGQLLSLIKLTLSRPDEEARNESRHLLAQCIKEVREMSQSLNLHWAHALSLNDFLEGELLKVKRATQITTSLEGESRLDLQDVQKKIILFRILQECLHNILKHAQAHHLRVQLEGRHITLHDDGIGFNEEEVKLGAGLANMRHRASLIGARMVWYSESGKGTQVQISFNL